MKNLDNTIQELNYEKLVLINGGSPFTRELFEHVGELLAVLSNALASDREHGLHECN